MKILGIGGSLRKGSYSMSVLRSVSELLPDGAEFEIADLSKLPVFNQDSENPVPAPVEAFKKQIEAADAILFCTPEYNYSIPGYLKNAIDWGTRPPGRNSFNEKPCAAISVSDGNWGGIRAILHLRQVFLSINVIALNRQVMVALVTKKLDSNGKLVDDESRKQIKDLVEKLVAWEARLRKK